MQFNKENEKSGVKVTMLAFMIKAAVAALEQFPGSTASLDGEQLVLKNYFHIGFAADTPNGLVGARHQDADQKGIVQISQKWANWPAKARDGQAGPADMQAAARPFHRSAASAGATSRPSSTRPKSPSWACARASIEPQRDGKQFAPRLMLPLSLSWDHRVIDGAAAARFNAYFGSIAGGLPPHRDVTRGLRTWRIIDIKVPDIGDFDACGRDRGARQGGRRTHPRRAKPGHQTDTPWKFLQATRAYRRAIEAGRQGRHGSVLLTLSRLVR